MTPASDPVVVEDVIRRTEDAIKALTRLLDADEEIAIDPEDVREIISLLAESRETIVKLNTELREAKGLAASRLLEMQSLAKRLDERPNPYAFVPR